MSSNGPLFRFRLKNILCNRLSDVSPRSPRYSARSAAVSIRASARAAIKHEAIYYLAISLSGTRRYGNISPGNGWKCWRCRRGVNTAGAQRRSSASQSRLSYFLLVTVPPIEYDASLAPPSPSHPASLVAATIQLYATRNCVGAHGGAGLIAQSSTDLRFGPC